jgi:hypothetical protein
MRRRDWGPPDRGGGPGSSPGTADHHHHQSFTKAQPLSSDQHLQGNAAPRHLGRYASGWREGFAYGFRDALRLAARRLGPETWHALDRLADEFELAGGDG